MYISVAFSAFTEQRSHHRIVSIPRSGNSPRETPTARPRPVPVTTAPLCLCGPGESGPLTGVESDASILLQLGYFTQHCPQGSSTLLWDGATVPFLLFCVVVPDGFQHLNSLHAKSLQLCPILCDSMDYSPPGSSALGVSPGKNTGVGCRFLLQGIFPTQGPNLRLLSLPHGQAVLYHQCLLGSLAGD